MTTSRAARPAPTGEAVAGTAGQDPATVARRRYRTGFVAGVVAYGMWGFFPLYFPLLEPANAVEILAHRIVWSLLVSLLLVAVLRAWGKVRAVLRDRRRLLLLVAASALICVNWGVYIWAVNSGYVVETALGYFVNPLLSVVMGVLLLRERLRRLQWVAFALAVVAVVVLTVAHGELPWIALILAFSFGTYGLCKKLADVESVPSLAVETAVSFPFALGYLVFLQAHGTLTFGHVSWATSLLLAGSGVITVLPLLAFNAAAVRIPLSVLGLLLYLTPVLQFGIGVLVFHEQMPPARWAGFGIVWLALAVFTADALRGARAARQRA